MTAHPPPSPPTSLQLELPGVTFTSTGATVVGVLDRDLLAAQLSLLSKAGSWSRWVVGDLFAAMVAEDGGDEVGAIAAVARLDFDQAWLATSIDVAAMVAPERRRRDLAWGHHEAVSHLDPGEQDTWLGAAASRRWTVVELRHALREHAQRHQGRLPGTGGATPPKLPKPPAAKLRAILAVDPAAWVLWQPSTGEARKYDDRGGAA